MIQQLKNSLSILDIARQLTDLKRRSAKRYIGLCPFHKEKTGSFYVYPDQGRYHCYGCQADGDVLDLYAFAQGRTVKDIIREYAKDQQQPIKPVWSETKEVVAYLQRLQERLDRVYIGIILDLRRYTEPTDLFWQILGWRFEAEELFEKIFECIVNKKIDFGVINRAELIIFLWSVSEECESQSAGVMV